jgi:serine/threonine protein phosphatase PrpC
MKQIPVNPANIEKGATEEIEHTLGPVRAHPQSKGTAGLSFYGAVRSDIGSARERNEDSCFYFSSDFESASLPFSFAICLIADGMGGYEGGDLASQTASRTAVEFLLQHLYLPALKGEITGDQASIEQLIGESVQTAHESILSPDYLGNGGTTMTIALALGRQLYLAHVGDSRAYWLVDGDLQQLTKDHSLVQRLQDEGKLTPEEAENFQFRNILTRALGQDEELIVDVDGRQLPSRGKLLLCSDGLCGEVSDREILPILDQEISPDQIANQLVAAALEAGGWDNISAIVVEFTT